MKNKKNSTIDDILTIAFIFDSEKIDSWFYGAVIFKNFICGREVTKNSHKIIMSLGDIIQHSLYSDISPIIIHNNICTISRKQISYNAPLFVLLAEDIDKDIATQIDSRLQNSFPAYLGMTTIDISSTDARKQFWKMLIRHHSIEKNTITYFTYDNEENFPFSDIAESNNFTILKNTPMISLKNIKTLCEAQQSRVITSLEQLELTSGKNDASRSKLEMNFALVREVDIAGIQIWKAIEDINCTYLCKEEQNCCNSRYVFTSLYQASQGIERLLKIILTFMMYISENESEIKKLHELLLSHRHNAMIDFILQKEELDLTIHVKKIILLLFDFYSKCRYNNYSYCNNRELDISYLLRFGTDIDATNFDQKIKSRYGKALGQLSRLLYNIITELSHKLNIFTYEIDSSSVARFVLIDYYEENLYTLLKRLETSKKELLWYLIKKGKELPNAQCIENIEPLPFETSDIPDYISYIIKNNGKTLMLYDFISYEYENLTEQDKKAWKARISNLDVLEHDLLIEYM